MKYIHMELSLSQGHYCMHMNVHCVHVHTCMCYIYMCKMFSVLE